MVTFLKAVRENRIIFKASTIKLTADFSTELWNPKTGEYLQSAGKKNSKLFPVKISYKNMSKIKTFQEGRQKKE